jgi:hypothetical protein
MSKPKYEFKPELDIKPEEIAQLLPLLILEWREGDLYNILNNKTVNTHASFDFMEKINELDRELNLNLKRHFRRV